MWIRRQLDDSQCLHARSDSVARLVNQEEELREVSQLHCMGFELAQLEEAATLARVLQDAVMLAYWQMQCVAWDHRVQLAS